MEKYTLDQQSTIIKGIAHQLLNIASPTFGDVIKLFSDFGLNILTSYYDPEENNPMEIDAEPAYAKDTVKIIDPPEGWKYGFPMPIPKESDKWTFEELRNWLVKQGYPGKTIDNYGDHFHCRYWNQEQKT